MAPTVERIADIPNPTLGEGPHWDSKTQSLYFVDVFGQSINRYAPSTGQHTKVQLGKNVSIIIPVKGKENQFVSAIEKDIVIITWDGVSEKVSKIEKIAKVESETKNNLNDGKCDSKGRLWIGTYDAGLIGPGSQESPREGTATFVVLDNKNITTHVTKLGCSNGLTWNKKFNKLYHIDSLKKTVDAFDFDLEKGLLSNRTEVFTLSKHAIEGIPDGMTIDEDDNLWVAAFGASSVLKIDPKKPETLLETIKLPAKQVTSLAWGGKNLDELFVTTGRIKMSEKDEELSPPNHGAVYRITNLGTKGLAAQNFVL